MLRSRRVTLRPSPSKRRTTLLLALLVITGSVAAWLRYGAQTDEPLAHAPVSPPASSRSKTPAHPRIDDQAGILAPFGPRLGRMADDFPRTSASTFTS